MEPTPKWVIDPGHSAVQFKIKHFAIANILGAFKIFQGTAETDNDVFDKAKIGFEINAESIDTNNKDRDIDLKSDIFLHTEKFPKINFRGEVQKENDDYKLVGDLTILETTKEITLSVEHTGAGIDKFGKMRTGFEVTGKINRKDFGLNFNMLTEVGSMVVGEEIKVYCTVELIKL